MYKALAFLQTVWPSSLEVGGRAWVLRHTPCGGCGDVAAQFWSRAVPQGSPRLEPLQAAAGPTLCCLLTHSSGSCLSLY